MPDMYETLFSEPDLKAHLIRFEGGTAAVTKLRGKGVTVSYVSTGVVDLIWSGNGKPPGAFAGLLGAPAFNAVTQSGVKGYTCVAGAYSVSTRTLRINITNASETLADLAANQFLTIIPLFISR